MTDPLLATTTALAVGLPILALWELIRRHSDRLPDPTPLQSIHPKEK